MPESNQVTAQDARSFLTTYGHAEDSLKGMADDKVLELHGAVFGNHQKAIDSALKAHTEKAPVFGEKWRETLAGEDAEDMKTLQRFQDPTALWKRTKELTKKLSSGELKANVPFPDKGTAEEQAAWRKEQGVPEKPEGYDLKLDNGIVIGEDDKPLVDEFLKFAHGNHVPQSAVKKQLEWFLGDYREKLEGGRAESKKAQLQAAEDQLRKEWGPDYRANMNAITGLLDGKVSAKSGLKERILESIRLEPEFAQLFAGLARELDPMSTLTGGGGGGAKGIVEEWQSIQKTRKEDRNAYNKDEKMQARERELITAMQRLGLMDESGNLVQKK